MLQARLGWYRDEQKEYPSWRSFLARQHLGQVSTV